MLGKPNAPDSTPEMVWRWTSWEDEAGLVHAIPPHAKVISRGAATKSCRYALVCHSDAPLALPRRGTSFNPARCRTLSGKRRGPTGDRASAGSPDSRRDGRYEVCFKARLIHPWAVKFVRPEDI